MFQQKKSKIFFFEFLNSELQLIVSITYNNTKYKCIIILVW